MATALESTLNEGGGPLLAQPCDGLSGLQGWCGWLMESWLLEGLYGGLWSSGVWGGSVNHCRELLWAKPWGVTPVGGWVPPERLPIISSYRSYFFFSMLEVSLMYIKQER